MKRSMVFGSCIYGLVALALLGCGGEGVDYGDPADTNQDTGPGRNYNDQTIQFVRPTGGPVSLGADPMRSVPIEFSVSPLFEIKPPGMCSGGASNENCGHVHIHVDNSAEEADGKCPGKNYNNSVVSGTTGEVHFSCLLNPRGEHKIRLELHRDDHRPFTARQAWAEATVIASPATIAFPMTISTPAMNSQVALGNDEDLSVEFTPQLADFELRAPGQCAGNPRCGHMHLTIDPQLGAANNCDGMSYNTAGAGPTIKARFRCVPEAKRSGPHIIGITLHRDDHSPFMLAENMKAAGAWVRINVP